MLWVPQGFAHGFRVMSQTAHVVYKTTDFYAPEYERTVAWNDPALKVDWKIKDDEKNAAVVSGKDQRGLPFSQAETFD
jgi:dTDP-4-dehydrorhamnose 3,5-epimerase